MDREAWQATVQAVTRFRHDLETKPPPKYKTNEHFYKAETDSQTLRTDLSLPRWMADEGGKDWELGIN